jgi:hypothetical protein
MPRETQTIVCPELMVRSAGRFNVSRCQTSQCPFWSKEIGCLKAEETKLHIMVMRKELGIPLTTISKIAPVAVQSK